MAIIIVIVVFLSTNVFTEMAKESYSSMELENAKTQACFRASNCSLDFGWEKLKVPIGGSDSISLAELCEEYGHGSSMATCLQKMCNCEEVQEGNPSKSGYYRYFGFRSVSVTPKIACLGEKKLKINSTVQHGFEEEKPMELTFYLRRLDDEDWTEVGSQEQNIGPTEDKEYETEFVSSSLQPGEYLLNITAKPVGWNPKDFKEDSRSAWIYSPKTIRLEVIDCDNCYLEVVERKITDSGSGGTTKADIKLRLENKLLGPETFEKDVKLVLVNETYEKVLGSKKYSFEKLRDEAEGEFKYDKGELSPGIYNLYLVLEENKGCELKVPKEYYDGFEYFDIDTDSKYAKPVRKEIITADGAGISDLYISGLEDVMYNGGKMDFDISAVNLDNRPKKINWKCKVGTSKHQQENPYWKEYGSGEIFEEKFRIDTSSGSAASTRDGTYMLYPGTGSNFELVCSMSVMYEDEAIKNTRVREIREKIEVKKPVGIKITDLNYYPETVNMNNDESITVSGKVQYKCLTDQELCEGYPNEIEAGIILRKGTTSSYEGFKELDKTLTLDGGKKSFKFGVSTDFLQNHNKFTIETGTPDMSGIGDIITKEIDVVWEINKANLKSELEGVDSYMDLFKPIGGGKIPYEVCEKYKGKLFNDKDLFEGCLNSLDHSKDAAYVNTLRHILGKEDICDVNINFVDHANFEYWTSAGNSYGTLTFGEVCSYFNMTKAMCLKFLGCPREVVRDWKLLRAGCDLVLGCDDWSKKCDKANYKTDEKVRDFTINNVEYFFLDDPNNLPTVEESVTKFDWINDGETYCCVKSGFMSGKCNSGGTKNLYGKGCENLVNQIIDGADLGGLKWNNKFGGNSMIDLCHKHHMNKVECARFCIERKEIDGYLDEIHNTGNIDKLIREIERSEKTARLCNWFHEKDCRIESKNEIRSFINDELKVGNTAFTPKSRCQDLGLWTDKGNIEEKIQPCLKFCGCW